MPMNYGWSNTTPKCIKFFHIAHQKATLSLKPLSIWSQDKILVETQLRILQNVLNIYITYIHLIHPYIYIYICNIYIVWTQATPPPPTPFSYLIFSRLIIFTFRNYFILYKIVWCISENILEYRVPKFA